MSAAYAAYDRLGANGGAESACASLSSAGPICRFVIHLKAYAYFDYR
jgi:hypothetical protein